MVLQGKSVHGLFPVVQICSLVLDDWGNAVSLCEEASITLFPKSDKDNKRKKRYRPLLFLNIDAEILKKILT